MVQYCAGQQVGQYRTPQASKWDGMLQASKEDKQVDRVCLVLAEHRWAVSGRIASNSVRAAVQVRRDEYSKGLGMSAKSWDSLFMRLRPDVPGAIVQYPAVPPELAALKEE